MASLCIVFAVRVFASTVCGVTPLARWLLDSVVDDFVAVDSQSGALNGSYVGSFGQFLAFGSEVSTSTPQRFLTMLMPGGFVSLDNDPSAFNFGTRDFAFSLWLRYRCVSTACPLISKRYDCIRGNFFNMWFPQSSYIRFETDDGTGNLLTADFMSFPTDAAWHFMMFVRNSTGVSIYVDGAFGAFNSGVAKNIANNDGCVAGAWNATECPQYETGFVGDLADIAVFVDNIPDPECLWNATISSMSWSVASSAGTTSSTVETTVQPPFSASERITAAAPSSVASVLSTLQSVNTMSRPLTTKFVDALSATQSTAAFVTQAMSQTSSRSSSSSWVAAVLVVVVVIVLVAIAIVGVCLYRQHKKIEAKGIVIIDNGEMSTARCVNEEDLKRATSTESRTGKPSNVYGNISAIRGAAPDDAAKRYSSIEEVFVPSLERQYAEIVVNDVGLQVLNREVADARSGVSSRGSGGKQSNIGTHYADASILSDQMSIDSRSEF